MDLSPKPASIWAATIVIDVPDMAAALAYAEHVPSAAFGTIEVRPLMDYNPAG